MQTFNYKTAISHQLWKKENTKPKTSLFTEYSLLKSRAPSVQFEIARHDL
jgi:hypothetical protein